MSLKKCTDCGKDMSSGARKCPHCGKTYTTPTSIIIAVIVGLVLFALFF